jgi:hypothetical protein
MGGPLWVGIRIQALYHKTAVKVLGTAIYDIEGLTCAGGLDQFWTDPIPPNPLLYQEFREYLLAINQVNGSFSYRPTKELLLRWSGDDKAGESLKEQQGQCIGPAAELHSSVE